MRRGPAFGQSPGYSLFVSLYFAKLDISSVGHSLFHGHADRKWDEHPAPESSLSSPRGAAVPFPAASGCRRAPVGTTVQPSPEAGRLGWLCARARKGCPEGEGTWGLLGPSPSRGQQCKSLSLAKFRSQGGGRLAAPGSSSQPVLSREHIWWVRLRDHKGNGSPQPAVSGKVRPQLLVP